MPELLPPQKVAIGWLITHVDWKHWVAAIGILITVFLGGIQSSKLTIVQELFGIKVTEVKTEVNKSSKGTP